ncbi:F0F1 ATP synthase subunit delta [Prevotella ihumii]|uniref:F0F1 ATP synthase subunit delta n=1 Tax=Prevotella ihumii TaxID=1917878 RepID=UPI0009821CE6|nr:F0F1 ATP synthase subunit delta [Prevotella ihumii]
MDIGVISVRYGRALLKGATAQQVENEIYEEVQTLLASYMQVPELRFTIDNPMLQRNKKQEILEVACGGNVSELMKNFIALVLNEGREGILLFIANSYISLYRKQKNIIQGKLTTAVPVTPQIEEKMKAMVQANAKGTVEFNAKVDPDIIGGFILEYDTYRMDASVKTKLNNVLTQLKK